MYVPRAMYSLSTSFCTVPVSFARGTPCSSPTTTYIASRIAAVALMVIEVETWSSGISRNSSRQVVDRVDRDADPAHLALRHRVVGVVAHLRRQIERGGEPHLPRGEQLAEAVVGLLRGAEAGVLAHGPEPAGVHRRVDAAREGKLARARRDRASGSPAQSPGP